MRWLTTALLSAFLFLSPSPGFAQDLTEPDPLASVEYQISFANAQHHEARVTVIWRNVPAGPLRVQMSRSSPGRYAIHEFAKNVYDVSARDGSGRELTLGRGDPYGWTVAGHDGTVSMTYTLYGDRADGTYTQIDATHAHLNMPATFMWASGYDAQPIRVRFLPFSTKWKVATQLPPTATEGTFWAPNLQYFMDSPTELSEFMLREWTEAGQTYRLAIHHEGTEADADRFVEKVKKVVRSHIGIFGEPPRYDFGSYTFIADYMPQASGDGMEHRNSTIITDPRSLYRADDEQLDTLSHEFFHSWNVERIRPVELEPFDFTRANPTPELWFAEGFTSYYGPLMMRRSGVMNTENYLKDLSKILNYVVNNPARTAERINASPQEMSLRAPFVDAARSIDPVNSNVFVSYYPYGAVIALALDLELRQKFAGKSLDGYMRLLWHTHGAPERPYTVSDLKFGLSSFTGDAAFAESFFRDFVAHGNLPDLMPLLQQAGVTFRLANSSKAWIGVEDVIANGPVVTLVEAPAEGTPLYLAGADRGDQIVSLGRTPIANVADWKFALSHLKLGEATEVRFVQRGIERTAMLTPSEDPLLEIVREETSDKPLSSKKSAFRKAWLGSE